MSDFYNAYISAVLEAIYIKFYRDIRVVYTRENMPRLKSKPRLALDMNT